MLQVQLPRGLADFAFVTSVLFTYFTAVTLPTLLLYYLRALLLYSRCNCLVVSLTAFTRYHSTLFVLLTRYCSTLCALLTFLTLLTLRGHVNGRDRVLEEVYVFYSFVITIILLINIFLMNMFFQHLFSPRKKGACGGA